MFLQSHWSSLSNTVKSQKHPSFLFSPKIMITAADITDPEALTLSGLASRIHPEPAESSRRHITAPRVSRLTGILSQRFWGSNQQNVEFFSLSQSSFRGFLAIKFQQLFFIIYFCQQKLWRAIVKSPRSSLEFLFRMFVKRRKRWEKRRRWTFEGDVPEGLMNHSLEKFVVFFSCCGWRGPVCLLCAVCTLKREKLPLVGKCNEV